MDANCKQRLSAASQQQGTREDFGISQLQIQLVLSSGKIFSNVLSHVLAERGKQSAKRNPAEAAPLNVHPIPDVDSLKDFYLVTTFKPSYSAMDLIKRIRYRLRHPNTFLPGSPDGILRDLDGWLAKQHRSNPVLLRPGPLNLMWPDQGEQIRTLPLPKPAHPSHPCQPLPWRVLVTGSTALYRLHRFRILGREGTILSPDNRIVEAFTYTDLEDELASHPIFRRRRFAAAVPLRGTYASITYPSSFAWYHWVTESLPRLKLLLPFLDAIDGLFIPADTEPQIQQSLLAMGVEAKKLIPLSVYDHYEPEFMLIPRYCAGLNLPLWVPEFLQESIGLNKQDSTPPHRKLYISRADAGKRRILNEKELIPDLERAGFECVCLRDYSFTEQVRLFHQAACVIGAHGAGLVNVLYCRPSVQVIEITPSSQIGPHLFHSITACVGGTYWWLPGVPTRSSHAADIHQDFNVDPKQFSEALQHTGVV
jgi:capsular polysaccharide biosynthesis protein